MTAVAEAPVIELTYEDVPAGNVLIPLASLLLDLAEDDSGEK